MGASFDEIHGDELHTNTCVVKENLSLKTFYSTDGVNDFTVTIPSGHPFAHIVMNETASTIQEVTVNFENVYNHFPAMNYIVSFEHDDETVTQTYDLKKFSLTKFKVKRTSTSGDLTDKAYLSIMFVNQPNKVVDNSTTESAEEPTPGGGGSGNEVIYELIDPYLTQDNGQILEQAGDTPAGGTPSTYDNGYMLFDGLDDPNDETTNEPTNPSQTTPPSGIRWFIYDGVSQNGYATFVYDFLTPRTITNMSFNNMGTLNGVNLNAETIEAFVSDDSNVPIATSTKIIDLSNQGDIERTGLVSTDTPTEARYLRIKVSHANTLGTHVYGLTGAKIYGYPFIGLISPNILKFDDGKTTVSGNAPSPISGNPSYTDGWHVFDGLKSFSTAITSGAYPDSQGWLGDTASGSWLMYDFGSAKTVTYLKVWNYDDTTIAGGVYPKGTDSFTISGSDDASVFTDLVTETGKGSTQNWTTIIPTPAAYRFYKITVNNHATSTETVCGFIELEVYGN